MAVIRSADTSSADIQPSTLTAEPIQKHAGDADENKKETALSILYTIPAEIRNVVYDHYFPSLPPASTPLQDAYKYSPSTALCFVDKTIHSETTGYLTELRAAWNTTTWTINLDDFFPRLDVPDRTHPQPLLTPKDVVTNLSNADTAQIHTLSFTTSAFALPHSEHQRNLTTPFTFTLRRLSTHRIILSTPLNEAEWATVNNVVNEEKNHPLHLDPCIPDLLLAVHSSLLEKQYVDAFLTKRGRHP